MRSPCPIAGSLDIFGDKWTLLVVRDLFAGGRTYGELQESPEHISSNLLADRLKRLELSGLVEKRLYQSNPPRYSYHLTAKGRTLGPVLKAMADWGEKSIPGTRAKIRI